MAIKQVVLSDLSGTELDDNTHTRVVVRHPDFNQPLELDISTDEAGKLANTTLRLVEFQVFAPNQPPRTALVESKVLDKTFEGVDFDAVLQGARKAVVSTSSAAPRKRAASSTSTAEKVDYTSPEHAGKLHRGRITDAEKDWVKANQDKASYNREQQTGKAIDWSDPAEAKRYGL